MLNRVFVTGIGSISSIGKNILEMFDSLINMRSGIKHNYELDTIHKPEIPVCTVDATFEDLLKSVSVSDGNIFTRTSLLGMIAAREALLSSGIINISGRKTGLVSANTVGGMDKSEVFLNSFLENGDNCSYIDYHDCGDSTEKIADYLGIKDYLVTISTACSASANSIAFGTQLIKHKFLDRAIVGGTDALTRFTLNGFNTLQILDKEICKPFDENRAGISLGEAAGYLVLESEESVLADKKNIICEITGYGNACDAFHQTATSPNGIGPRLAMKKALSMSGLASNQIDYINAHGTGTQNNDLTEGKAIEEIFSPNIPRVSSTKGYTGHTLGAAGAVEAIICALSIQHNTIFPTLNFSKQMKELSFTPVNTLQRKANINHVLSNSFGFGGNNTSLIFSRY